MDYYNNVILILIFYDLKDKSGKGEKKSYNNRYKNI